MTATAASFTSLFSFAIEMLRKAVAREGFARGPQALIGATLNRIARLERRFNALVALWRAGKLPVARGVRPRTSPRPSPQSGEGEDAATRVPSPYPRGYAWLRRFIPHSAPPCAGAICGAMYDPGMEALHALAPQVGRILRPLCHMIGAGPLPEWLKLPKRRRVRISDPSPRPTGSSPVASLCSPTRGEGEDTSPQSGEGEKRRRRTAREIAEELVRKSDATGKPIDFSKVSPVVLGYILHPPRDGNCPPPEIGYGGRRWRPPKDYKPPDWD